MKLSCKVIEDMLPMYSDGVCSSETAALIEEHLKECPGCSQMLEELRQEIPMQETHVDDAKPLKKLQKTYKKLRLGWVLAALCVVILTPFAFLIGQRQGEQQEPAVDYTPEEAVAYANEFMICLVNGDYADAFTYWDIDREKRDLLIGDLFTEEDLQNFEADGLEKFCQGGIALDELGGIEAFEFVEISEPSYANSTMTEDYTVTYTVAFNGNKESFCISVTKYGIHYICSANGLIRHPLSHLSLWVQWVVDDYQGVYYDFESGQWIDPAE